jgi:outer membrane protein TolC
MGGMNMGGMSVNESTVSPLGNNGAMSAMNMGNSTAGMTEVLSLQLEAEDLDNNIESLEAELLTEKIRFNLLLNRSAESELVIPDTMERIMFADDMDEWMQTVVQQNPMLKMTEEERLSYEAKTEMARKMGYPMFGIGLEYMLMRKADGMNTMNGMNGKDMVMPMVSISIPVYRNKYKATQREGQFLQQEASEKYAALLNQLQAELYRYKRQMDDASRKITLYRKQVSLVLTTCELMVREFASGKATLADIIGIQRRLLDYRLKETEAIAACNTAAANIRKLISNQYHFENIE